MRSFFRRGPANTTAEEKLLDSKKSTEEVPKATVIQLINLLHRNDLMSHVMMFHFRYASTFDRVLLLAGGLVAIATGVGMPLMSIIMGNVSQNFMNVTGNFTTVHQFEHDVIQNCLKYVYLGCGIFAAATIQAMCFLTVCENLVNQLRREFFKAILRQDITWFDKNHSGTLATKLFDNLERVKEGTGDKLGLMIQFVAQFFGGFIVAFTYDWKLTLIMMSLAPFMIICGAFIAKLMATAATREAKKYAVAGGIAEEVLSSMRTVFFSVMMGSMALGQAGPQFAVLGTALGAAGSLYQIIDREPEIDAYSPSGVRPKNLKGKISVSNVKFTYPTRPDVPILKGISFEANPGETVALVGSSGCGKSTIIQLLLRYYNQQDGKITIDGVEIDKINIEFLRNYIGVVSQEPVLFNTTIEQASKGRTTIVIAHRLSTIRTADKIVAMKDGEVIEVGTHDELIARKGLYYELVNAQVFADVDEKSGAGQIRSGSITSRRSSTSSTAPELRRLKSQQSHSEKAPISMDQNDPVKAEKDLERLKKGFWTSELEEEGAVKANLFKILRYARPEWGFLILAVFSKPPGDASLKSDGHFWALMFLVLGGVEAITMIIQV
ncbi:ABC transporter transmembrane region [Necator americanus]|uniref:ABC transporter transmembrane region n=1 Tax=Necator americanus TaxID=51031 RepID=W2TU78_NECAM|nr:ABC transporter transmembrane region [Necator americanus]ETN84651.1 ABC transporter transmembrane region [Necator americanus]